MTRFKGLCGTVMLWAAACVGSSDPGGPDGPVGDSDSDPTDTDTDASASWRSALYPEDWTPDVAMEDGRFLHDHSYAGYRAGGVPLPAALPTPVVDVVAQGADPTGLEDSTASIQAVLDGLTEGGTAWIPEGTYRIGGRLEVTHDGVVVAGAGWDTTFLHFTKDSGTTDGAGLRFLGGAPPTGAEWLLSDDAVPRDRTVVVADAAELSVGDDVALGWTITPAFIEDHGMTGTWTVSLDAWRPFFRRTIEAIDGDVVTLDVPVRYPAKVRDGASLRPDAAWLREVGVRDLAVSTVVDDAAAQASDRHHAVHMKRVADGWVRGLRSYAARPEDTPAHLQSGGILVDKSRRVTVDDVHLGRAQNRGGGANGYLFEIMQAGEVLIRDSVGEGGRHNFIANWDFGTSGCVFLRTTSRGGVAEHDFGSSVGFSEFHHSLAMANLIDQSVVEDGWQSKNRHRMSSGAGHAGTQNTFWNLTGAGELRSLQYELGYVIGTGEQTAVLVDPSAIDLTLGGLGTAPQDHTEGLGQASTLEPPSLYEDQLARRLAR